MAKFDMVHACVCVAFNAVAWPLPEMASWWF